MNAATLIRIKNWNVARAPTTAGVRQQRNFEEVLAEALPSDIMQVVHLLLCLQILNDVENMSTMSPLERGMLRSTLTDLQAAIDELQKASVTVKPRTKGR